MIDINKIIKMVKQGSVFRSSFNLKKAQIAPSARPKDYQIVPSTIPTKIAPLKPETEEQSVIMPVQKAPVEAPVEALPDITKREEQIMDEWVNKNINTLIDLVGYQGEVGDYIEPSFVLPSLIEDNPNVYNMLSEKIQNRSENRIGENDANLFVDTLISKTNDYQKSIDEAVKNERESISNLEIILEEKIMNVIDTKYNGTLEEGVSAFLRNIGVKGFNPVKEQVIALLKDGIKYGFGIPGITPSRQEAGRDQRLNFFIRNPVHLQPFLEGYPELGIKYNVLKNDNERIAVLADFNNKNDSILFKELGKLVNELDMSVLKWIARGSNAILKGRTNYKQPKDDDEEGLSPLDNEGNVATSEIGKGLEGVSSEQQIKKEESNKILMKGISTAAQEYIEEDINRMKELNQLTSVTMMEENIQNLRQREERMEKELRKASEIKNKEERAKVKKGIQAKYSENVLISNYSKGEKLNAFFKYVSEQMKKTFSNKGKRLNSNMRKMIYRNEKGQAIIPSDILNKIFNDGMPMSQEQVLEKIPKSKEYIEMYKEKVRAGEKESLFSPDWRMIMSYKVALDAFADLGEIKSRIFDLQEKGMTDPNGVIANLSGDRNNELLKIFSNVEGKKDSNGNFIPTDPENVVKEKKYNFVYMTLRQGIKNKNRKDKDKEFITDIEKPMVIYKKRLEKEKELKEASKIENKVKRDIVEKEIKVKYLKNSSNLKAEIGTAYFPLLSYMERNLSQFSTEARRAFVDLFDHHRTKIRNFSGSGKIENSYDPQEKTNTELYYKIRGETPPKNVQIMMSVYDDYKRSKTQGAISIGDWRINILNLWDSIDKKDRAVKEHILKVGRARRNRDDKIREVNFKVLPYYEGNNSNAVLKNIKNPLERKEFEEYMLNWDRISKLPIKYYSYFKGQALTEKIIGDREAKLKKEKDKLRDIMKETNLDKMEINKILTEHKMPKIASSAMKIVFAQYKIVKKKLLKLSKMKQYSYKFASMGTELIEESIIKTKTDFYKLFDRLLR